MSVGSKYLPKDLLHQEETFLLLNIQALGGSRLLSQVYPTCSHWRQNVYQKIIPTLMISANNVSRMVSHAIPSLDSVWPQKLLLFHTVISDLEIYTQPMPAPRNAKTIIATAQLRKKRKKKLLRPPKNFCLYVWVIPVDIFHVLS